MFKINDLEYDNLFKSQFSPKPEVMHFSKVVIVEKPIEKIEVKKITEEPKQEQKKEETKENLPPSVMSNNELVEYEIRDITPKKLFKRKK